MNDSSRRFIRLRGLRFTACLLSAFVLAAPAALAADAGDVRLQPGPGQSGEIAGTTGQPVELLIVKSRADAPAVGETLVWTLEDGAEGRLEVVDDLTRAEGDDVAAGSARVRFTPAHPGPHGIRVQSPVDPACSDSGCRMVAHRFVVMAAAVDRVEGDDGHTGLVIGAAAAAGAIALATILDDDGGDPNPGKRLGILSGNYQSALTNNPLAQPLSVLAMDGGSPAAGATINWTATGGATLSASSTTAALNGNTSVRVTSVGPGPGPVTVTASFADQAS